MNESVIERMLRINTSRAETRMDKVEYYNKYEPTPYKALETLFKHYEVRDSDYFVDFGSGKGRFSFYVNYFYNSGCTSVELIEDFHRKAISNFESYKKRNPYAVGKLFFVNGYAEKYVVSDFENKFYFFNPFSVNIFISVVNNIIKSVENSNREVDIILYYPSVEYISYLERRTAFYHVMDIPMDCVEENPRERFAIYRLGERNIGLEEECIISIDIKKVLYRNIVNFKNKNFK